jgi:hypothetical protein
VTPLDEVEALLGFDRSGSGGEPITWRQAVVEVVEAYPAYTLEAVGRLTVAQVRALRTGGRPELRAVPAVPTGGRTLQQMVKEARRKFHGTGGAG